MTSVNFNSKREKTFIHPQVFPESSGDTREIVIGDQKGSRQHGKRSCDELKFNRFK